MHNELHVDSWLNFRRSFLPNHAIEIFAYAFKYHNQELLNEAAPILACLSLHEGLQNLPPQCNLPWVAL